jgi:hypothetical protein
MKARLGNLLQKVKDADLQNQLDRKYTPEERLKQMQKLQTQAEKCDDAPAALKMLKIACRMGHPMHFKGVQL